MSKIRIYTLFLFLFTLVACRGNPNSTSGNNHYSFDKLSTNEVFTEIGIGDDLIDIDLDMNLTLGEEYLITFSFSNISAAGAIVTSSHTNVAVYEYRNNTHYLKAVGVGDTILVIRDSTEFIHYRKVVRIRPMLEVNQLDSYLFNVENWKSVIYGFSMYFVGEGQGVFKAPNGDDNGYPMENVTFTYQFTEYSELFNEFRFLITEFNNSSTSFRPHGFNLSATGDIIHIYDNQYTIDVFRQA